MKAIVQDIYGAADVLKLSDIDTPEIGDGDVLVCVRAAGVDRGVWHLMTGLPYLIRILGFGFRGPKVRVPGFDVAGSVEAVGADVTQFEVGDEVFGIGEGTFAEYARVPADKLVRKPANVTFEQAASVSVSGCTALEGVRDKARVQPGQRLLILGASGGVGSFAVQLGKLFGAEVTGVCSTAKVDLVRSIGADHVIDYTRDDFALEPGRYDAVLDIGGNRPVSDLRRVLTPEGTLVIVGGEEGGRWFGGLQRQMLVMLLSPFVRQKLCTYVSTGRQEELQFLREHLEVGKLTPAIDRTFPLSEAPDAIRYLEAGRATGKVVIKL